MIDAYASESHYRDHIAPIFAALPGRVRGQWDRDGSGPVIVASYKDLQIVGKRRPVILVEHGAGQMYNAGHPSYPGGTDRDSVVLFICPSTRVADANRERYPNTPTAVVGCPKLDRYQGLKPEPGVVGLAFHWNAHVCPESRSAMPHYRDVLGEIAQQFTTLGHAHPRMIQAAAKVYADAGIPVADADEVFARCEVLVVDNSSIGWEFIALDRPVVWLNAPWYRRDVDHGLRFWTHADAGIQVDEPSELAAAITAAQADVPEQAVRRRRAAEETYAYVDGHSAARAAEAIVATIGEAV